ncbi:hypothetical protein CCR75_005864 [Bremia lactucae]|uniref:Uncharacterized protein n=1 Tax=Bremia lactucae TaxID=4779 RepID=A0A976FGN7_BRELC|nr:hypothetical protein CCR75_005864 [Bremia lactucae]
MGLSRRAKLTESPPTTSSRFLAFFSHKKLGSPDEDKRTYNLRLRVKKTRNTSKRSRSRSFSNGEDDNESVVKPASLSPSPNIPVSRNTSPLSQCPGVYPKRSSRSSSLRHSTSDSSLLSTSSSLNPENQRHFKGQFNYTTRSSSETVRLQLSSSFEAREMWRESSVDEFLSSFPRDLSADVRTTCHVVNLKQSKAWMRRWIQSLEFEIRATKWAAYFLKIVKTSRKHKRLSHESMLSVQFAICAHVQWETAARHKHQKQLDVVLQHQMTEYRVALQCVAGTSVVKFGRKGKPHGTNLCVENGDTLRWTSKLLAHATHMAVDGVTATTTMGKKRVKVKNAIPLATIIRITSGPSTSVLARALHKGTLILPDAGCTLSVVTHTRTLDLKAKTTEEREWLQRSLEFLVALARDHERRVAQQVELTIMKRMETLPVWKYGRKGKPHKTRVCVDRYGEVSWLGRSGDSIQLDEIVSVCPGHTTPVFARARTAGYVTSTKATASFSLITSCRTLDIEAINEYQRDWFVVAFRYLLDKVHEKTAAMQRERAERQLRMMQDLCRDNTTEKFFPDTRHENYNDDDGLVRHI